MKQRCTNPKNSRYSDYGGRGITFPERWKNYKSFRQDMGECPEGYSLDRIDVNSNYSKENCRWANNSLQGFNQRLKKTNKSGKSGVHFDKARGKWLASITVNMKTITLGRYLDKQEAIRVRKRAEIEYFGEEKKYE